MFPWSFFGMYAAVGSGGTKGKPGAESGRLWGAMSGMSHKFVWRGLSRQNVGEREHWR